MFIAYMKMTGIKGECTDAGHEEWIEILDFQQGVILPVTLSAAKGKGRTTQNPEVKDLSLTKFTDRSSPLLYRACSIAEHIKEVVIEVCRPAGAGGIEKFLVITLQDALITSVSMSTERETEDTYPVENMTISFAVIHSLYIQEFRDEERVGGQSSGGWSLVDNEPVDLEA